MCRRRYGHFILQSSEKNDPTEKFRKNYRKDSRKKNLGKTLEMILGKILEKIPEKNKISKHNTHCF